MLQYVALRFVTSRRHRRQARKNWAFAMSTSAKAEAVLALHRFGMGPRPGSIAALGTDPRGALIAELDRPLTLTAAAASLPPSAKAYRTVADANARRAARAKQAQQQAKKQQMAAAPV